MFLFNQNICSNSNVDNSLVGHYMKSFFSTIKTYFSLYHRSLIAHLHYLENNIDKAKQQMMISRVNNPLFIQRISGTTNNSHQLYTLYIINSNK